MLFGLLVVVLLLFSYQTLMLQIIYGLSHCLGRLVIFLFSCDFVSTTYSIYNNSPISMPMDTFQGFYPSSNGLISRHGSYVRCLDVCQLFLICCFPLFYFSICLQQCDVSEKEQNLRILSGALGYYIFSTDFPKLPLYKFNCFLDPILFIYLFFYR